MVLLVRFLLLALMSGASIATTGSPPDVGAGAPASPAPGRRAPDSPDWSAELARAFPDADSFTTHVATLDDRQRTALAPRLRARGAPRLWTYREARKRGELLGRVLVDDVIGKSLPITYMLILSTDNRVRAIEILNYRESHGGEVRREKWRAQFTGLDVRSPLRIGTDIRNIAGATLSCRALTDGVHDALEIAESVFAVAAVAKHDAATAPPARRDGTQDPGAHQRTQLLMGTLLDLRAIAADRARFDAAADAAFARVAVLESLWSTWRADSEISRLNAAEPGVWCSISPPTVALLARTAELRRASSHGFSIEAGPQVQLWQDAELAQIEPTAAQIAAACSDSAVGAFELDAGGGRARRRLARARLDLGAIAKGAALDEVAAAFRSRGLTRALFDFGGQLLALEGPRPDAGWPVVVRDPRPGATGALWELELALASLSTSADDQRGRRIGGRMRSHIVDPRSGMPAQAVWTACALAASATEADAWSTAGFVLGSEVGIDLAGRHGVRMLSLNLDGTIAASDGFPGHASPR